MQPDTFPCTQFMLHAARTVYNHIEQSSARLHLELVRAAGRGVEQLEGRLVGARAQPVADERAAGRRQDAPAPTSEKKENSTTSKQVPATQRNVMTITLSKPVITFASAAVQQSANQFHAALPVWRLGHPPQFNSQRAMCWLTTLC